MLFISLTIILLSLISTITLLTYSFNHIFGKQRVRIKLPPGPRALPFLGNLHQFDKANPHIYLWNLSKKYGPLAYLEHGATPVLVVSSARMAKEILQIHDRSFCSRPSVLGQQKLSYGGIDMAFSPFNDHWKEMRRICNGHLFSPKKVSSFRPTREDEVSHMVNKIANLCSSSETANLSEIAMSMASNLICRVAFGRRYDDNEYEKIRFDRLVLEAQSLMVSFYFSDYFPAFGWLDKLSGILTRLGRNWKELDSFYQQLIEEHLNRPQTEEARDILDLMLRTFKQHKSSPLDLKLDHIKAMLMDLFVAGTDTVAAAVVWSMTALTMNPKIMNKAQKEIREIIGSKRQLVTEDDIKNLPYLKAVVLEALRMYPPAPILYRKQIAHDPFMVNGYEIRPDTRVIINGWALARDPENWSNPNEFSPERFENNFSTVEYLRTGEFEMIPFGGGRRGCPGMGMGLVASELALANLLYSFDWELPKGMERSEIHTDALPGLTMHKKNALVLVPKKYKG